VAEEFERYVKVARTSPKRSSRPWPKRANPRGWPIWSAAIWASTLAKKQELLETLVTAERLEKVYGLMQGEMSVLQVEKEDQVARQDPDGEDPARILSE
jgi:ATP-dependent Lon protease